MFMIFLRFSANKDQAPQHMDGHIQWLQQGFDDGVFLLSGGIQPNLGGAILAQEASRERLDARVRQDPFVAEKVAEPEIVEIAPAKADDRLAFLLSQRQHGEQT